jgi:dihydrofolate reductase
MSYKRNLILVVRLTGSSYCPLAVRSPTTGERAALVPDPEGGVGSGPGRSLYRQEAAYKGRPRHKEKIMTAMYTFDVFCSLDGFGSYNNNGDWGGYWGKQGPQFLDRRLDLYDHEQRMVFGAKTFRENTKTQASSTDDSEVLDPWITRMRNLPTTVVSTTLEGPFDWPDATIVRGDAVDIVARLKEESDIPLRSHGSLSLNRALMAAGLVDLVQVTLFPVITGQTGARPIFQGAADFDL